MYIIYFIVRVSVYTRVGESISPVIYNSSATFVSPPTDLPGVRGLVCRELDAIFGDESRRRKGEKLGNIIYAARHKPRPV